MIIGTGSGGGCGGGATNLRNQETTGCASNDRQVGMCMFLLINLLSCSIFIQCLTITFRQLSKVADSCTFMILARVQLPVALDNTF